MVSLFTGIWNILYGVVSGLLVERMLFQPGVPHSGLCAHIFQGIAPQESSMWLYSRYMGLKVTTIS